MKIHSYDVTREIHDWDSIFKKEGKVFIKPQEDIKRLIKLMKKEKIRRILDLGCGSGRHTIMLVKEGFSVYSTDISKEGIKLTKEWLKKLNLKAKLKRASCYEKFPFKDNFFDAIISTQVIHHNYHNKIKFCISEIERVLKPNGILFVSVAGKKSNLRKRNATKFKMINKMTCVPLDGKEKGSIHYIYTKTLLKKDFKNFKMLNIHMDKGNHYCFLGILK